MKDVKNSKKAPVSQLFHQAAKEGNIEKINSLYLHSSDRGCLLNSVDVGQLWTPLHWVCYKTDDTNQKALKVLEFLLEKGADINWQDPHGRTPLHLACRHGRYKVVRCLLTFTKLGQLYIDLADRRGQTPLFKAVQYDFPKVVELLLQHKANPNLSENQSKNTPTHIACKKGHWDCFKLLLEYGADCSLVNHNNDSPLHICCEKILENFARHVITSSQSAQVSLIKRNNKDQNPLNITQKLPENSESLSLLNFIRENYVAYVHLHLCQMKPIAMWTKRDVSDYLDYLGFGQYIKIFEKNDIDGKVLKNLDQKVDSLKTELGIESYGHRVEITQQIQKLKDEQSKTLNNAVVSSSDGDDGDDGDDQTINLIGSQWLINFDELVLGDIIGKGFFGEVRRADWKGVTVAVKYMYKINTFSSDEIKFLQEIAILSNLRHPNIINFIGWSKPKKGSSSQTCQTSPRSLNLINASVVMVTEFLGGGTLHWLLQNSFSFLSQSSQLISMMILEIVRGMTYLHSRNILHRDLNTKNILLDEHYHCKISDFGLSRLRSEEGQMTAHVGFLVCMAPEVYIGEEYSFQADVYSFAMVIYQMLVGKQPNDDVDPLKFAHMVAHESYRPPLPVTVPPMYNRLIVQCWQPLPDDRPQFSTILDTLVTSYVPPPTSPVEESDSVSGQYFG